MGDLQNVTVKVLDKDYKLRIEPTRESALRRAAELINSQAKAYARQFAFQESQDLLAMVALTQITELIQTQDSMKYKDKELIDKLTELDTTLEKHLHPTQNSL